MHPKGPHVSFEIVSFSSATGKPRCHCFEPISELSWCKTLVVYSFRFDREFLFGLGGNAFSGISAVAF